MHKGIERQSICQNVVILKYTHLPPMRAVKEAWPRHGEQACLVGGADTAVRQAELLYRQFGCALLQLGCIQHQNYYCVYASGQCFVYV